jgi:hypothetical protein
MGRAIDEKRRYARHGESVCAWLTFHYDALQCGTLTEDLSSEGACFSTLRPIHAGEQVLLNLQVDPTGIECKGKVCWALTMPNGLNRFGVRFVDIGDDEREQLSHYLVRRQQLRQDAAFTLTP